MKNNLTANDCLIRSELWSKQFLAGLDEMLLAPMIANLERIVAEQTLPMVNLPTAIAMGAAAVIIKNPVVSRRFWGSEECANMKKLGS